MSPNPLSLEGSLLSLSLSVRKNPICPFCHLKERLKRLSLRSRYLSPTLTDTFIFIFIFAFIFTCTLLIRDPRGSDRLVSSRNPSEYFQINFQLENAYQGFRRGGAFFPFFPLCAEIIIAERKLFALFGMRLIRCGMYR